MTLNQLRYFCTASRCHSITKAAEELYVTQPTISMAIRDLEIEFGISLFSRKGNQLSLTQEGESFYKKATYILQYCNELQADYSSMSRVKPPLRIGIPPMLSTVFFPELLMAFHEKHPEIAVVLEEYGSVRACNLVQDDTLDVALVNIYMYQGNYLQAESLLAKVISGGFYMLDSSNYNQKETITDLYNNGSGTETILAVRNGVMTRSNISLGVPSLVPLMTYTDVLLSYAECLCKNGRTSDAEIQLNKLVTAKELQLSGVTVLDKIKSARLQLTLYCDVNFAFLKRTGLAKEVYGVENYRLLLPIPQRDVIAGGISQNTGY